MMQSCSPSHNQHSKPCMKDQFPKSFRNFYVYICTYLHIFPVYFIKFVYIPYSILCTLHLLLQLDMKLLHVCVCVFSCTLHMPYTASSQGTYILCRNIANIRINEAKCLIHLINTLYVDGPIGIVIPNGLSPLYHTTNIAFIGQLCQLIVPRYLWILLC